jgi:hypothetical protein
MSYGNILPTLGKGASTVGVIDYSNSSSLMAGVQEDPEAAISAAITDQTLRNQSANLLAMQAAPNATSCSQSFFSGVCDWIVYAAAAAAVVGVVLIGGRR